MAVTKFTTTQVGTTTQYTVTFEVIDAADIDVYVDGVLQLQQNTTSTAAADHPQVVSGEITQGTALINYTVASNNGTITFNEAPDVGAFIVLERTTDDTLLETFVAGSTIRAQDLNNAFERVLFIAQEGVGIADEALGPAEDEDDTYDALGNRISNVGNATDDDDAVNRGQLGKVITDDLIAGEGIDLTDVSGGTNSGKQVTISGEDSSKTNKGIVSINEGHAIGVTYTSGDAVIAADKSTASQQGVIKLTAPTVSNGNPITLTRTADGDVELTIEDNSIDFAKIKDADIIVSGEGWANNDTTIATTARIDEVIDAAITNDIGADSTGITVTDDGDGTITLGLADGSIDLGKIKATDIVDSTEQNADYDLTGDDDSIFTSLAAVRRFENYVQNSAPSGTGIGKGRVWVDVDDDLTLSVWNGSAWVGITSGGTFTNQPSVVYVDQASGDNANDGHRISRPKATIKNAVEQINSEIEIDVTAAGFNGGSGYVDDVYSNVSLTHSSGTGIGTGLTATVTVSGGIVTAITLSAAQQTTLEEYSIGDVLTASNADLGGSGSGLLIPITGTGDGQIVIVSAGTYQEVAPIQIKRRNVSIIGQALRSCIVHPTVATENNNLFELNSGSYISSLTLTGVQAGTGTGNTLDATLPTTQGWNFAFYDGAYIVKSPYIQNCTNFSDSEIDNNDLLAHRPRGGAAGDTDSAPTGGGMLINGATPADDSPLRSMVADSYTHVGLNGPGVLVTNNGYAQITSSYAFFNKYHIKCLNGGQANLAASTTDFGDQALVADGRSTTNIFTANCVTAVDTSGAAVTTIRVSNGNADASWHGSQTRPATNMLLSVNSDAQIYPILGAVPQDETTYNADPAGYTGDWIVTISRPNPNNRSENLGFSDDVATGTDNVQFWLRSMVASSGHTMEYVGSGTNYSALPENGGVPDESKQITESNNGKVWTAITDHNGKFKIGGNQTTDPIFEVDQQTGFITIPEGSIAFNLLSDTTPQLGGDLDVNGNTITSTSNANVVIDPNGTGTVDVSSSRITSVTDPTSAQDAATKNYVDTTTTANPIYVAVAGDTMSGELAMGTNKITGLGDPTANQDAATKAYVDTEVGAIGTPSSISTLNTSVATSDTGTDGTITFTTDGTTAMTIDNNQRLGVGTTSPTAPLSVVGGTGADPTIYLVGASNDNARIGSKLNLTLACNEDGTESGKAITFNNHTSEFARIDSSGRVGIGTSSPQHPLQINATNPRIRLQETSSGGDKRLEMWVDPSDSVGYIGANQSAQQLSFQTASTDRIRITNAGNVGIGTTSPTTKLHVQQSAVSSAPTRSAALYLENDANCELQFVGNSSNDCQLRFGTSSNSFKGAIEYQLDVDALLAYTAGSEAARIDSSGRLLVGTSTATTGSGSNANLQIEHPTYASQFYINNGNSSISSGAAIGEIKFHGKQGGSYSEFARILVAADGTTGSGDAPGRLVFSTTADGASSPTERLRIANTGAFGLSGANYGSSGDVLTSQGSGSAPQWATPAAAGLTKTTNASTDISGATTFIMSGIDSDAEEIHMYWSDFYTSNGNHWHFRFGTEESGGTIYTSGYVDHSHFSNSTTGMTYNTTIINFNGAGSTSTNHYDGMIRISKRRDHEYYYQAYTSHKNAGYWWLTQGNWTGSSALTRIQWIVSGGSATISGGTAQIVTFA